ncbi:MAG: hypothetical protein ACKO3T_05135 [Planctomycetaceae bacterium]
MPLPLPENDDVLTNNDRVPAEPAGFTTPQLSPNGQIAPEDVVQNMQLKVACPNCQRFSLFVNPLDARIPAALTCQNCNLEVEGSYVRHRLRMSAASLYVSIQLSGHRGHGKSHLIRAWLTKFYKQLPRADKSPYKVTSISSVTEYSRTMVEQLLAENQAGATQLPTAGHEPALLQEFSNLPDCDDLTVGLLDYSGEYFTAQAAANHVLARNFYQPDNQLYVFVISPNDLIAAANQQEVLPENALLRVIDTLEEHGEKSAEKSLLVIISKGDQLLTQEMRLPDAARNALQHSDDGLKPAQLLETSQALQKWTTDGPVRHVLGNFTATARNRFKRVEFTIVSATGANAAANAAPMAGQPANILGMYMLLNMMLRPAVQLVLANTNSIYCSLSKAFRVANAIGTQGRTIKDRSRVTLQLAPGSHPLLLPETGRISGDMLVQGDRVDNTTVELHQAGPLKIHGVVRFHNLTILCKSATAFEIARHQSLELENCRLIPLDQNSKTPIRIESSGSLNLKKMSQIAAYPLAIVARHGDVNIRACTLQASAGNPLLHLTDKSKAVVEDSVLSAADGPRTNIIQLHNEASVTLTDCQFTQHRLADEVRSAPAHTALHAANSTQCHLHNCRFQGLETAALAQDDAEVTFSSGCIRTCQTGVKLLNHSEAKLTMVDLHEITTAVRCLDESACTLNACTFATVGRVFHDNRRLRIRLRNWLRQLLRNF